MSDYAAARAELLAAAQRVRRLGLVTQTAGNLSLALGPGGHMLITPSALPYEDMAAADLAVVQPEGPTLAGQRRRSSEWQLHHIILRDRPNLGAVVHTLPIRRGDGGAR